MSDTSYKYDDVLFYICHIIIVYILYYFSANQKTIPLVNFILIVSIKFAHEANTIKFDAYANAAKQLYIRN